MLFIFDKDGTLCYPIEGEFINNINNQGYYFDRLSICTLLKRKGHETAIVTNQGGIAFGLMSMDDAEKAVSDLAIKMEAGFYVFSPFHPNGTIKEFSVESNMRKPGAEMLLMCMRVLGYSREYTVYIGDREEDELAAKNAGVKFISDNAFFNARYKNYIKEERYARDQE